MLDAAEDGCAKELELIQPHSAQKPVLRGEVGCACVAREVSVERGGMGERGCARRGGRVREGVYLFHRHILAAEPTLNTSVPLPTPALG